MNQSILLDAKKIMHKAPFKKLEAAFKIKILDQYIPLVTGTAFLIQKDGYLLTNAHIIKNLSADAKLDNAQWSFTEFLAKHMLTGCITEKELNTIFIEYTRLIKKAEVVLTVKAINRKEYEAQVIAQQSDIDLALLKIELQEKIEPFVFEDKVDLKEGDSVYTIGYPLPFLMDKVLDDFRPILTKGNILAIKNDVWDIQHTAAVSPGNAGGPLLTQNGRLIGVNVAQITNGYSLYYAIMSKKIITWLREIDKFEIKMYSQQPLPE